MTTEQAAKALRAFVLEYLAALDTDQLEELLAELDSDPQNNDDEGEQDERAKADTADKATAKRLFASGRG